MSNEEAILIQLEKYLSEIRHDQDGWVELIVKRWDDILEDKSTLSAIFL
jgi:hypothetical protein